MGRQAKPSVRALMVLALVSALAVLTACAHMSGTGASEFQPGTCRAFFEADRLDIPPVFQPFVALPQKPSKVKLTPSMPGLFAWYMRSMLTPDYAPSDQFISRNLRLYVADEACRYDRMVLVYHKGDADCMMVATVLRVFFFARRTGATRAFEKPWSQRPTLDLVRDYVTIAREDESAEATMRHQGQTGVFRVRLHGRRWKNNLSFLDGVVREGETGLSVSNAFLGDAPAHVPQSNAWFEHIRQGERRNEAADREMKRRYNPKNVERERRELLREMSE